MTFSSHHDRTFSFSSLSSSSSFSSSSSYLDSPLYPTSPFQSFGVPFSWEDRPGIRRKSRFPPKHKDPCLDLLPPPPAGHSNTTHEFNKRRYKYIGKDPFVAALAKCSKKEHRRESMDDYRSVLKPLRAVNDVVGIVDRYTSCKTACSVVDSQVFIPRSGRPVYNLTGRRSRFG